MNTLNNVMQARPARRAALTRLTPLAMALSLAFMALPALAADNTDEDKQRATFLFEKEQESTYTVSRSNLALQSQMGQASMAGAYAAPVPYATSGSGGLNLCPGAGGSGASQGSAGAGTVTCTPGASFVLFNNANGTGGNTAGGTSTASVIGYTDGRLSLKGDAGVTISGPTTFDSDVAMSGMTITGLGNGTADSHAVNVGQLKPALAALGATFNADGSVTAPTFNVQGGTQTTVGDALSALDGVVTSNTTHLTTLTNNLNNGTVGLVQQSVAGADITVAAGKDGAAIDFSGTGGARVLKGVAAGALSATSGEAVNGAQLFATNTTLDGVSTDLGTLTSEFNTFKTDLGDIVEDAGAVVYDDAVAKDRITLGGASGTVLTNLQDGALSATSTDAVTGRQLFATNQNVDAVTTRVTNIESTVSSNSTAITNITNDINNGTVGLVQHDAVTGITAVAAAQGGNVMDMTGTAGARRLTGLANGVDDLDAATIAQLKASGLIDASGNALGAVVYDAADLSRATLGGASGTVLANLGNGLVASGSMEAINGGQLWNVQQDLQNQVTDMNDRVVSIEDGIANGSIGSGGFTGDAGGSTIGNVGAGVADTDAVNVAQLKETEAQANAYTDQRFDEVQDRFDGLTKHVDDRFNAVESRIDRMGSMSAAYAGMAMNTAGLPGRNRVGVGVGGQGSSKSLAAGYQRIMGERGNVSVSLGGAFSGSEKSVSGGAGMSW